MLISKILLKNWRNFRSVDAKLGYRAFLVGPNASGKSNFLDAIRFLRDIAKTGGGLQKAVQERGGLTKIRCLAARQDPDVEFEIHISDDLGDKPKWIYAIGIAQEVRGYRQAYLKYERVWKEKQQILNRPDDQDVADNLRLTQTHLEQINANLLFRAIANFFESIQYLHIVPQLVRHPDAFPGPGIPGDPFGLSFLDRLAQVPEKTRKSRLGKIGEALRSAVPQLKELSFVRDDRGLAHLEAVYEHWRPHAGKQREDQFSDGTIRLIGLLWSLFESDSVLLLEEPELSLHPGIVKLLPALIYRLLREKKRQIIITTHSADLLSDRGIGAGETLILRPHQEGTEVEKASDLGEVTDLLNAGLTIADAVLPRTLPLKLDQLNLFE
ncbi:MAG: AAA family ATPase [Deltaproteobacteria bacterium]|nr:AAA family ATPase [Deltaproteobacteria bacterium]